MPKINGNTIVQANYKLTGAGRKLIRLNSGTYVGIMFDSTKFYLYKSTTNMNIFGGNPFYVSPSYGAVYDVALETDGTYIYIFFGMNNVNLDQLTARLTIAKEDGSTIAVEMLPDSMSKGTIDSVNIKFSNDKKTLIVSCSAKDANFPNSFNIKTVTSSSIVNGIPTWSAPEQISKHNTSSRNITTHTIEFDGSVPMIICLTDFNLTANNTASLVKNIMVIRKDATLFTSTDFGTGWTAKSFSADANLSLTGGLSSVYVPKRIEDGKQAHVAVFVVNGYITCLNSTDGGINWVSNTNLYPGSQPSISYGSDGRMHLIFKHTNTYLYYAMTANGYDSWSTSTQITTVEGNNPSLVVDGSLDIKNYPPFICKTYALSKYYIKAYGDWIITTISPKPGDIGQKTDENNLLTYSITTDGEMSTITEKINGTVVNTRNTTSGQAVTLGLTQAQWDAIRFGKYADATGGKNTLTVEMGSEKWTYTFDKRLATDADILSAVKATKDANEVYLPSVKAILGSALRGKGVAVNDTDRLGDMAFIVSSTQLLKSVPGTAISSSTTKSFTLSDGTTTSQKYITIDTSLLGFTPKLIKAFKTDKASSQLFVWNSEDYYTSGSNKGNYSYGGSVMRISYVNGAMDLPVNIDSASYDWIAYS